MDTIETIKTRRSIRHYSEKPVEPAKLQSVLEAARYAPSWANLQCWRFVVVTDHITRRKISDASFVAAFFALKGYSKNPAQGALAEAPVIIVICADPEDSGALGGQQYYMTDVGIVAANVMLAAHALGLGTVFVGVFDELKLRDILRVPESVRVVGLVPLGYPHEEAVKTTVTSRKSLDELVYYGKWKP